ncbi:hypothetical protein KW843_22700 [Acidovorax sp. sif1233]|uniref:hypothetical protein n=1 Tax=Acidovorax sp. sif1233 TaxID=2854792 RepID=UPI001C48842F|nr:hypothetical protein [Acidovorax sp. sif1233]MBV7457308.1 hypothetical protein [Acidovorax sp. sif1233]
MSNLLEKIVQPAGGGPAEGGSHDEGGGGPSGGLPPAGSACYGDLMAKVAQLWPFHIITHVQPDKGVDYLRVSDFGNDYVWKVWGTCQNGHIKINYTLLQQPGGVRSS